MLVLALTLSIPLGLDLFMPVPEDNAITTAKLELGRKLFHDRRLSRNGTISCASCHEPARAFSDKRPLAVGVFGRMEKRHAPALINRGYGRSFFWDGRIVSLEEQVLKPIQDANEMDLTLDEASSRVTPTLREVARTAPYMHDGSMPALTEVVDSYSDGGRKNPFVDSEIRPLRLSDDEKRALIRFLESLSGTVSDGHR